MTIQAFIEKAIEGGYDFEKFYHGGIESEPEVYNNMMYFTWHTGDGEFDDRQELPVHVLLLDPEAWKAVGTVEGWKELPVDSVKGQEWWRKMHDMIDALAEGKTLEQFFETL